MLSMKLSYLLTEDLLVEGRKDDAIRLFRKWNSPYDDEMPFRDLPIPKFVDVIFDEGPHR